MGKKNKKTVYKKLDSAVLHAMDVKKMSLTPQSKTGDGSTSKGFKSHNVSNIPAEPNPHVIDSNISSGAGKCNEPLAKISSDCFEPSGNSTNSSFFDDTRSPESNIREEFGQCKVNEDSYDWNEARIEDKSKSVDKRPAPDQSFSQNLIQEHDDSQDWEDEPKMDKKSKLVDKSQMNLHDQPFRQHSNPKHNDSSDWNDELKIDKELESVDNSRITAHDQPFRHNSKQKHYGRFQKEANTLNNNFRSRTNWGNNDKSSSYKRNATFEKQNQSIRDPEDSTDDRTENNSRDFKERKLGTWGMNNTKCENDEYADSNYSSSWSQDNDSSNWHTSIQKSDSTMEQRSLESSDTKFGKKDKDFTWHAKQKLDPRKERRSLESSGTRYENEVEDISWRSSKQKSDSRIDRSLELFDTSYEKKDEEYKQFEMEFNSMKRIPCTKIIEEQKDLFDMSTEYSLAHCVAQDMRMGSGIAVQFKREFKEVDELLNQRQKQGGLAFLEIKKDNASRYIYYLVTKRLSTGKPTYYTFWSSLKKMRDHIRDHGVEKLAIPRIGCGLDRLEWSKVKYMIEFLFRDVNIEIVVCSLLQAEDDTPKRDLHALKVVSVETSIWDIEPYTIIVYFSTEDGHVTNSVIELDRKFNFLSRFRQTRRNLGDAIRHYDKNRNYILYGCIVRKSKEDLFDFQSLKKCLLEVNKNNRQDLYEYVAFEALGDENGLLQEKVLTLMRFYLRKVDIYVCLPREANLKE